MTAAVQKGVLHESPCHRYVFEESKQDTLIQMMLASAFTELTVQL